MPAVRTSGSSERRAQGVSPTPTHQRATACARAFNPPFCIGPASLAAANVCSGVVIGWSALGAGADIAACRLTGPKADRCRVRLWVGSGRRGECICMASLGLVACERLSVRF
jgi:hypothetical protein